MYEVFAGLIRGYKGGLYYRTVCAIVVIAVFERIAFSFRVGDSTVFIASEFCLDVFGDKWKIYCCKWADSADYGPADCLTIVRYRF